MSRMHLALVAALTVGGGLTVAAGDAAADCTYTVDGHVKVRHQLPELQDARGLTSPLVGVQVRVQSRSRILGVWGTWSSWSDATTDSTGFFSRSRTTGCGAHQVRVHVKFDGEDLEIHHEHSTSSLVKVLWYQVFQSGTIEDGADVHLDTTQPATFAAGGLFELGNAEARAHADIWVLYHDVFDTLDGLGTSLGFVDKVKIKFPHNGVAGDTVEASYANPMTGIVYIFPGTLPFSAETPTLLHELMHLWAYQHSRGEGGMAWDLVGLGVLSSLGLVDGDGFDTHGFEANTGVAFHEGFAEFASIQLMTLLFGEERTADTLGHDLWLPFDRSAYSEGLAIFEGDTLTSFGELEHFDAGWQGTLAALVLADPVRYDFGEATTGTATSLQDRHLVSSRLSIAQRCPTTWLAFGDVLRGFLGPSLTDPGDDLPMAEMSWSGYTARLVALGLMSSDDVAVYEGLLDPGSTDQLDDLATCTPIIITPRF